MSDNSLCTNDDHKRGSSNNRYIVYNNDLKFKNSRKINPNNAIWDHDRIEYTYYNKDLDTIKYRLKECINSDFSYLDLSQLDLETLPNLSKWKYYDKLKNIKFLFLNNNKIKFLDKKINHFANLEVLDISCNNIKDVPFIPKLLKEFVCHGNRIESLQSSPENIIEKLDCSDNLLSNLTEYYYLTDLLCYNNKLESIPEYKNLTRLVCKNNHVTFINFQPKLLYLDCSTTMLTNKITDMPSVKYLICNYTRISDISNFSQLESLEIINTDITKIPYIKMLEHLIFKNDQNILLHPSFKVLEYVKEHDNSYIRFKES